MNKMKQGNEGAGNVNENKLGPGDLYSIDLFTRRGLDENTREIIRKEVWGMQCSLDKKLEEAISNGTVILFSTQTAVLPNEEAGA
jgi:hypothetical protein